MAISIIKKENMLRNRIYVYIPSETMLKLKQITKKDCFFQLPKEFQEDKEFYEMEISTFSEILEKIVDDANYSSTYSAVDSVDIPKSIKDQYVDLKGAYQKLIDHEMGQNSFEYNRQYVDYLISKLINGDENCIDDFLDKAFALININNDIYHLRDLINAKDDALTNLKLIASNDVVAAYSEKYNQALKNYDFHAMETILLNVQQMFLDHWRNFTTKVEDYKSGSDFRFICHSTGSTNFQGDFYTRFVSCSLLTEKIMDTYHSGFGFILDSKNIVGASGSDMYVINSSSSTDNLMTYSSIPKIDTPEKVIKDCLSKKKIASDNNVFKNNYNEVVIDGFKPIGIFCLTDGSKELNNNYNSALKLKQCFPDLDIIEIDKSLYEVDYTQLQHDLICSINAHLTGNYQNFDNLYCNRFQWFWKKFLELKKQKNYTKEDIINLYKENSEMISIFFDFKKLFTGEYDISMIRYILMNNYAFNINFILEGEVRDFQLKNLYDKLKDISNKNILEEAIPGLKSFIEIYPHVTIDEVLLKKINEIPKRQFTDINKLLISQLTAKNRDVNVKLEQKYNIREVITFNIKKCEEKIELYNLYSQVSDYQVDYMIAQKDCADINSELDIKKQEKKQVICENKELNDDKNKQESVKLKLQKFGFIYWMKIKHIDNLIEQIKLKIQKNDNKILSLDKEILSLEQQLIKIQHQFKEKTGYSLDQYLPALEKAQMFISQTDNINNQVSLMMLNDQLQEIDQEIKNLEKISNNLERIQKGVSK